MRVDGATVHFDERANERQPDSEPAIGMIERMPGLNEQVEDRVQHLRWDTGAIVADTNDGCAVAVRCGVELHVPASWRVFDRIAQEIDLDLLQTSGVAVHPERFLREIERQFQPPVPRLGPNGLGRFGCDYAEVDDPAAQLDLVLRDATRVKQVVEQPRHLARLAF